MAEIPLTIGLSLGADLEWPVFFEDIVARLDPRIPRGDDTITFRVERVTIEPFLLRQPVRYAVLLDRLTHWYHTSREWIKKAVVHDDLYVFNNPFTLQSMEKHTSYAAMMRLGPPGSENRPAAAQGVRTPTRPSGNPRAIRKTLRYRRGRQAESAIPAT